METFRGAYQGLLDRGARAAIGEILAVKKGERVIIVSNPQRETREISMALYDAAIRRGAETTLMFQREKGQFDFADEAVIKALGSGPDVVISISSDRLGKDRYGLKHGYKGTKRRYDHVFDVLYEEGKIRAFWSPGITTDIFSRTVAIDYRELRSDAAKLCRIISSSEKVKVTAPGGTDVVIGIKGRRCRADDGNFTKPGLAGNVPSGEVFVSPALGTTNGTIAFDGSIVLNVGEIVIKRPILARVKDGYVTGISGGTEADKLKRSVLEGESKARKMARSGKIKAAMAEKYARNAWSIGELGIGLNRKAKIVANMLEDEKVYGTCHFAVGSNYDGDAEAMIHLDGLVRSPTITAIAKGGRETRLMTHGKLAWD
jgi:aminopeptidase